MYTDAFGNYTLPPSEYGYDSFILTGNATFVWPYNTDSSPYPVAKVMDFTCQAGNIVTLPNATEVSTGEDFLIRNVGANPLTVHNANGVQIATVAIGAASYFYLTDNTTAAGVYGVIGFGVGTSTADAASLVGYGIKAVGASLNQAHPVFPTNTGITVGADHRAKLIVFTGGTGTFALTAAATLGDDYFTMFRNEGTGTATIDPASSELIDGMGSLQVQPGESLMLICTGTQWYSVGYGRSTLYQFTQLTKDVSAGGTITLTAAEASNKLITFIGNPTGAVNVVVPSIVAVYYTQSAISTAHTVTLKTAAGSGTGIDQGARIIALCDGTNVVSAQSAVANTSVSLTDGSAAVPSLYFATQTDTGLYKSGTQDFGVTVAGTSVGVFGSTGLQTTTIGANSTQRHALPAVSSDTVALLAATQTLTNKSVDLSSNTLTGTLAQFNTALTDGDFASLAGVETLTSKTISGASNTLTNIANASLTNSSITINGSTVALGGSTTVTATATSALTIGTGLSGSSYNGSAPVTIAIDSTVATLAGAQTLTNKTITAPAITGGSINNTPIGGTTPAAGAFTTLSASGSVNFSQAGSDVVNPAAATTQLRLGASGFAGLRVGSDNSFNIDTYNSASPINVLKITQAGAATFNHGLSVTGGVSGNLLVARATSNASSLRILQDNTAAYGYAWQAESTTGGLYLLRHDAGVDAGTLAVMSASGNLGLGVVPSASARSATHFFGYSSLRSEYYAGGNLQTKLLNNGYEVTSTAYTYIASEAASMYYQQAGTHSWFTAPSGTAGNPITFSQAATLDANGYYLLGYTSSNGAYKLQVNSQIFATSSTIATSDGRYKENVTPITGALDLVQALNPVTFSWKPHAVHNFPEGTTTGFIAQEVRDALDGTPYVSNIVKANACTIEDAVYETVELSPAIEEVKDEDGNIITASVPAVTEQILIKEAVTEDFLGIAEGNLISILTAAIKELKAEFDAYKGAHP